MTDRIARRPPVDALLIVTDRWTAPFWEAARAHRLVVQRCAVCACDRLPPTPFCPRCRAQDCIWPVLTGRGTIFSFTVDASPTSPSMAGHVPYVPALIEFADAPTVRLVSVIVDAVIDRIRIDAAVDLVWQDRADGLAVPRFRLIDDAEFGDHPPRGGER